MFSQDGAPEQLRALLGAAADAPAHVAELNVGLVKSGSYVILFDTGTGVNPSCWSNGGGILESLKAVGVAPEDITKIVFTPAPHDHPFDTMTAEGKPVLANPAFDIVEHGVNFWMTPDLATMMPPDIAPIITATQGILGGLHTIT